MTNKKRAARIAATIGRREQNMRGKHETVPMRNYNLNPSRPHAFVAPFLDVGEENAITAGDLAILVGVSDPRVITRAIERERLNGIPICASNDGYYLPSSAAELERYMKAFCRRRNQMRKTEVALRTALDRMTGQQSLEG